MHTALGQVEVRKTLGFGQTHGHWYTEPIRKACSKRILYGSGEQSKQSMDWYDFGSTRWRAFPTNSLSVVWDSHSIEDYCERPMLNRHCVLLASEGKMRPGTQSQFCDQIYRRGGYTNDLTALCGEFSTVCEDTTWVRHPYALRVAARI